MKMQTWLILAIGILSCNSPTPEGNTPAKTDPLKIEELEKQGFDIFRESPEEAIQIFRQVAIHYEKNEQLKKAGITNLNIANIFDEYLEETDSALVYSKRALEIWQTQKDTLQMANLYKYIGLLKGKSGETEQAKSDIQQAISMYQTVGFDQGVAVSEFNLADVYFRARNYKESESLFLRSTEFWKRNGGSGRVFTNNILGIQIYQSIEDKAKVEQLIEENKAILNQIELDEFIINRFTDLLKE